MSETSDDIRLYNGKVEPAIADLTPSVPYVVKSGAGSILWNRLAATSVNNTNIRFNANINPQFIIDREFRIRAHIKTSIKITRVTTTGDGEEKNGDDIKFKYGETDALRPFPLNQMIRNARISIGTQVISLSQRDIFDLLLKCTPKKFLSRYNSTCPSYIDSSYKKYSDRSGTLNDPLQGFEDALLSDMIPNGAFPITVSNLQQYVSPGVTVGSIGATKWLNTATFATATIDFDIDEPLFVSPFIFTSDMNQNKSGFVGINTYEIDLGLTGEAKHMFCASTGVKEYSNTDLKFTNVELHYKTYTASDADPIPIKSVIPYKKIERYISSSDQGSVAPGASREIISPNVNVGCVPDHFIVAVRKSRDAQTLFDASSAFFPIESVSVTFNNNTNLLRSCTAEDLWRLSAKNGSTQSFYEFRGKANIGTSVGSELANTVGSLLVISTTDLNLPPTMAPGTMANVLYNFRVNFINNEQEAVTSELVVMSVTDGIITIMNGSSQITETLLTEGGNAKVFNESPIKVIPELMYVKRTERSGGNLSGLLANKIQKALSGSGVKSGAGVQSGGKSSLFY